MARVPSSSLLTAIRDVNIQIIPKVVNHQCFDLFA